jgi:hypothetical protein
MTIFGPAIDPRAGFDEDVPDVGQFPLSHAPTNTTQALASTSIGTDSNAAPVHGPSIHKPSSNLKSALW